MIIPESDRSRFRLASPPKNRANLKDNIILHLESTSHGAMPLRHVINRYATYARRFNTDVITLLNELTEEGRCGMRHFTSLNRTFVFPASEWIECLEANKTTDVWAKLEVALRDVK